MCVVVVVSGGYPNGLDDEEGVGEDKSEGLEVKEVGVARAGVYPQEPHEAPDDRALDQGVHVDIDAPHRGQEQVDVTQHQHQREGRVAHHLEDRVCVCDLLCVCGCVCVCVCGVCVCVCGVCVVSMCVSM